MLIPSAPNQSAVCDAIPCSSLLCPCIYMFHSAQSINRTYNNKEQRTVHLAAP